MTITCSCVIKPRECRQPQTIFCGNSHFRKTGTGNETSTQMVALHSDLIRLVSTRVYPQGWNNILIGRDLLLNSVLKMTLRQPMPWQPWTSLSIESSYLPWFNIQSALKLASLQIQYNSFTITCWSHKWVKWVVSLARHSLIVWCTGCTH